MMCTGREGGNHTTGDRVESWVQHGSMGRSMHGFELSVLNKNGEVVYDERGQLAVNLKKSPLMWFRGYLNDTRRTQKAHSRCGEYYLTGDIALLEATTSLFWYTSRGDDVITSSGYRIGPFDVESCLMEDSRVAEVGISF